MDTKATYLASENSTYDMYFGRALYRFKGGKSKVIPTVLGLRIKNNKNGKGEPMFKVTGLPEIVLQKIRSSKSGGQLTVFN